MSDFVKSLAQSAAQIDKVASGSLYPHQSDGVAFLLSKRRVILADDMGLGKAQPLIAIGEGQRVDLAGGEPDADGKGHGAMRDALAEGGLHYNAPPAGPGPIA